MTSILPFQRRDPILKKKAALTGMESHTRLFQSSVTTGAPLCSKAWISY